MLPRHKLTSGSEYLKTKTDSVVGKTANGTETARNV